MSAPRNPLLDLVPAERATVPALLAARVERIPDAPFLRWEGRSWSYREAWRETRRFAAWVEGRRGESPVTRVASFLPNRPEALWAWLGTLAAGATYVPLNRAHRGEVLTDMLRRSRAQVLATDAEGLADLPDLAGSPVEAVLSDWSEVGACEPVEAAAPRPGDLAEVMYTSGTTGRSKAVELSHNQLCRGAGWVAWSLELRDDDVFHVWLPLFHLAGQVDAVLPTVIGGGAVALYPTFSRSRFWDQVAESGSTLMIGFPNVYQLLHSLPPREDDARNPLRAGVTGAMPVSFVADFEARFGLRVLDVYGMTEAEPMVLPEPGSRTPAGSCGRPNPDLEVAVLTDGGHPAAIGEIGEIACRARVPDVLTSGYEGDPEATAAATEGGWFHSGDLGRVDADGFLYFVDRIKHSIRRRGENISSWELEAVVCGHPAVAEACAIGVPSPLGEEDVKAVVVPVAGAALDPVELRSWCQGRMAAFMVPRYIEVAAALPRGEAGKVMKEELRELGAATWDAGDGR
ncbi:MAG TPA: AMP-binding protein [Solirubrobacterales bacterium]|nr:AMP-binding protein [Solirubrobacterales bacterium]